MNDNEIIKEILNGDHQRYALLVEKYRRMVFLVCLGFTHHQEDSNDLTQDVFMNAYRHLASFNEKAQFSTWLYRIAVNTTLNALRKKRNWFSLSSTSDNQESGRELNETISLSDEYNPEQAMIQTEEHHLIHKAIDMLPEKQRTAFVLSRYDELSQREIASIMETSEGAVEQLLIRAKNNLQKRLAPYYKK